MRILFFDDSNDRHEFFHGMMKDSGAEIISARSVQEACKILTTHDRFDLICLDHDMDEAEIGRDLTGVDVAEFINLHLDQNKIPRGALIHSWNSDGAHNIKSVLGKTWAIATIIKPFGLKGGFFHQLVLKLIKTLCE